jgi:hypothetical protein
VVQELGLEDGLQAAEVTGHRPADHPGKEGPGKPVDPARLAFDPERHHGSAGCRLEYGTTVRFYDASRDLLHVTCVAPVFGSVVQLVARSEGEQIVLTGKGPDGEANMYSRATSRPSAPVIQTRSACGIAIGSQASALVPPLLVVGLALRLEDLLELLVGFGS